MNKIKIVFKKHKNANPDTYFSFNILEMTYISTVELRSINLYVLNIFIQITYFK